MRHSLRGAGWSVLLLALAGVGFALWTEAARAQDPEPVPISASTPISSEEVRNLIYPNELTEAGTAP